MNETMSIKGITISRSETYNLGDYSNVRPEIRLTVDLGEGDDPAAVIAALTAQCRHYIHQEIDAAREERGKPALHTTEPRVSLFKWEDMKAILIIRDELPPNLFDKANVGVVRDVRIPVNATEDNYLDCNHQRMTFAQEHAWNYANARHLALYDWTQINDVEIVKRMQELLAQGCWATTTLSLLKESADRYRTIFRKTHYFVLPATVAAEYHWQPREGAILASYRYHPDRAAAFAAQRGYEPTWGVNTIQEFATALDTFIAERNAAGATPPSTGAEEPQPDDDDEEELEDENTEDEEEN